MTMGNDGKGHYIKLGDEGMWLNDELLFAMASAIIFFLEMSIQPDNNEEKQSIGNIISTIAEGIYEKIQTSNAHSEPERVQGQDTVPNG
jgi:hypothetical protein